ncbi:MAG: hypothetical protein Ct9H300mP8_08870 [Gammaproteobacteria bacterium]|nr:MAG: hypothetical protein Ct9H300mP8_08870 [Gammaproteobacteria bacterium]
MQQLKDSADEMLEEWWVLPRKHRNTRPGCTIELTYDLNPTPIVR